MSRTWVVILWLLASPLVGNTEFAKLSGEGTPHWHWMGQALDQQLFDGCAHHYAAHKNLIEATLLEDTESRIPQVLHWIWLGPHPFPPESVEYVRSWIAHHPGWICKLWTDRPRLLPCLGMEETLITEKFWEFLGEEYARSRNWGEKSDLVRFEILWREGGFYLDHDANCLRSFAVLAQELEFVSCLEPPHTPFGGRCVTAGIGLLGVRPHHPLIAEVITTIQSHWDRVEKAVPGLDPASQKELVLRRTYLPLTEVLTHATEQKRLAPRDMVLPAAYFFAKGGIPSLYSKHMYATTWEDPSLKEAETRALVQKATTLLAKEQEMRWWLLSTVVLSLILLGIRRRAPT